MLLRPNLVRPFLNVCVCACRDLLMPAGASKIIVVELKFHCMQGSTDASGCK